MKLFHTANCFFAIVLFNAGALPLAQEQTIRVNAPIQERPGDQPNMQTRKFRLVIHGGAGTIERSQMTPKREHEYRAGMGHALAAGYDILKQGGSSLDATEAAVKMAVQRLRARYRDLLRAEIARTVSSPEEIEAELRHLMAAFGQ